MKLTLTTEEAARIVANHFNLSIFEVQIIPTPIVERKTFPSASEQAKIYVDVASRLRMDNKIACIKELRISIPGLSLADSKAAIESGVSIVEAFISKTGSLIGFSVRSN